MSCSNIKPLLTPFECGDLPDLSYLHDEILKQVNLKHEELIKSILKQILKREVVLEDAKDLAMIKYPGDLLDYDLAYKGAKIGRVTFQTDYMKQTITFKPINDNLQNQ